MNEDEAEAALLALGPQLEWREVVSDFAWHASSRYRTEFKLYIARRENGIWLSAVRELALPDKPAQPCNIDPTTQHHENPGDAKAACERHYATGKWES